MKIFKYIGLFLCIVSLNVTCTDEMRLQEEQRKILQNTLLTNYQRMFCYMQMPVIDYDAIDEALISGARFCLEDGKALQIAFEREDAFLLDLLFRRGARVEGCDARNASPAVIKCLLMYGYNPKDKVFDKIDVRTRLIVKMFEDHHDMHQKYVAFRDIVLCGKLMPLEKEGDKQALLFCAAILDDAFLVNVLFQYYCVQPHSFKTNYFDELRALGHYKTLKVFSESPFYSLFLITKYLQKTEQEHLLKEDASGKLSMIGQLWKKSDAGRSAAFMLALSNKLTDIGVICSDSLTLANNLFSAPMRHMKNPEGIRKKRKCFHTANSKRMERVEDCP